jgi:hypothetical protein
LIRFKLYSDGGLRRDGFYYDNFKIKAISSNLNVINKPFDNTKIYPIPSKNLIYINSNEKINKIEIYDLMGRIISTINDFDIEYFSIKNLKYGIYNIKVYSISSIENYRIIKN